MEKEMCAMSKIEWTDATWNPIAGCRRISAGCDNCYAIFEARRKVTTIPHYAGLTDHVDGRIDWTGRFSIAPDSIFNKPSRVKRPTTWFVNSMSDLFGEGVTDDTIKRVFAIMEATPHHRYQVLTKRPNRAVKLAPDLPWTPNIWLGVSIEDDRYTSRADLLRKVPAAVRFISAEPLLGPLPSLNFNGIDWIIVGGESGNNRTKVRRMDITWVRDLRDRATAAGTSFFFKQWGNWSPDGVWHRSKKGAGRELDGRLWDEMPRAHHESNAAPAWSSIMEFRRALAIECDTGRASQRIDGQSLRMRLRDPIVQTLRSHGPLEGKVLREMVFALFALDPGSARNVNLHAWALVDLQQSGRVVASLELIPNARTRRPRPRKVYRIVDLSAGGNASSAGAVA